MSKEIEEMAKIMCQDAGTKNCNIQCNAHPICDVYFYAERLYKEGYRKKSEGEWRETRTGFHCSSCRKKSGVIANRGAFLSKFCPNCGAKIKGA